MPRCKKHRCCRRLEGEIIYKPVSIPLRKLSVVQIDLDEFEAMRLCDMEGLEQAKAGEEMGVSRGTVQRLLSSGRRKIIEAFLHNAAIKIKNGKGDEKNENMHTDYGE